MKFHFREFFEGPSASKDPDGTLVIHCPRCSQIVNNAHGVCGGCGEVAFQCRKCRHINYDRLDAFICGECGYCSSGSFNFQLSSAVASNAVAITDDIHYSRSVKMMRVATKYHQVLQRILSNQLRDYGKQEGNAETIDAFSIDVLSKYPSLAATLGCSSTTTTGGHMSSLQSELEACVPGGIVKAIARAGVHPGSLAEVLSESLDTFLGSSGSGSSLGTRDSRTTADIILRHAGREFSIDDDDSDILNLLGENGAALGRALGGDGSDPLSRLLASVQNRRSRRRISERKEPETDDSKGGSGGETKKSAELTREERWKTIEKLHGLMREAELEKWRLEDRIKAWQDLESGNLGKAPVEESEFAPCVCLACSPTICVQLLLLWLRLFQQSPDEVDVSNEMIHHLLVGHDGSQALNDARRSTLKEIALRSKNGSPLVLKALRLRLLAYEDANCSEILASIVKSRQDNEALASPFYDLAMEILHTRSFDM